MKNSPLKAKKTLSVYPEVVGSELFYDIDISLAINVTQADPTPKFMRWANIQKESTRQEMDTLRVTIWGPTNAPLVHIGGNASPEQAAFLKKHLTLLLEELTLRLRVLFFVYEARLFVRIEGSFLELEGDEDAFEQVRTRDQKYARAVPEGFREWLSQTDQVQCIQSDGLIKHKEVLPVRARQCTFIEARSITHAISDAPKETNYQPIEGDTGMLHAPQINGKKAPLQVALKPTEELWNWWGVERTREAVRKALKDLNFETNMTFQVTLACLLQTEHARGSFTLDDIIKLLGRDTDARRSRKTRQKLRREVWGNLLTLASMPVIGARNGHWREPGTKSEKRGAMPEEKLISRDPLLVITGGKTTDDKEPPKEISLTAGEWLMPHIGNREMLSDFGDVLKIAQIPRGKVSGGWAACAGLALQHLWREESTKAQKNQVSRGGTEGPKTEVLKFRPFTRRELLTEMFRCDDESNPTAILSDPKGRRLRAEEYWRAAVDQLKSLGIIGHYREMKSLEEMDTGDLNKAWLDQPLDIRPSDEILKDALEIHNAALVAKKRVRRSGKSAPKDNAQNRE